MKIKSVCKDYNDGTFNFYSVNNKSESEAVKVINIKYHESAGKGGTHYFDIIDKDTGKQTEITEDGQYAIIDCSKFDFWKTHDIGCK